MKQEVKSLEITPSIFFHIIITLKKRGFHIWQHICKHQCICDWPISVNNIDETIHWSGSTFYHSLTWAKLNRQLCLYVPLKHSGWCDWYACSYVHVVCADKTYRSMCLCVCMPVSYKYVLLPWHISACIRNILKWHCKTNTVKQLL